ncbi:MAG: DUF421 domain-containing protein [Acidobacteriota bacterium]|nr:DUF421 domain-containing protein [Acidobacteriota bacterium]
MFFEDWFGIFRVLVVGVLAYVALIFWLRISGKRTLSKWNAFDFVVTIAIGSTIASVILSKDVPYFEGVLALVLLILLQFVITWLSVRFNKFENLIKAEPTLLLDKGKFVDEAMKSQRVTESEVRAAVRSAGLASLEAVEAVVMETDGSLSVIKKSNDDSRSALKDVSSSNG